MFNPHIDSTCIQCASAENSCNTLKVVTSFQHAWIMEFITLASSAMEADSDPNKIIVEGSEDLETWNELYNSDLAFTSRKKGEDFVFSNHKSYKSYSIKFERKAESTKMNVGTYGVVQSYAKACTSNIHGRITGKSILPYSTMRPTEAPTKTPTNMPTKAPTVVPTNAPSPWVLGAKGGTCNQACNSRGLSCNAQKRTQLNTWEKMRDAFKLVGVTCDPSWPKYRPYPEAPYTNSGHDITKCAFQQSGFESSCSKNNYNYHISLCYCQ